MRIFNGRQKIGKIMFQELIETISNDCDLNIHYNDQLGMWSVSLLEGPQLAENLTKKELCLFLNGYRTGMDVYDGLYDVAPPNHSHAEMTEVEPEVAEETLEVIPLELEENSNGNTASFA
jgi:hypothetical protein